MDWLPQTNHHTAHCKALDTSNVASQGDRRKKALIFVYIIGEVAHAHAQNAPIEWFLSTSGLGVVPRLLSAVLWLIKICNLSHVGLIVFMFNFS